MPRNTALDDNNLTENLEANSNISNIKKRKERKKNYKPSQKNAIKDRPVIKPAKAGSLDENDLISVIGAKKDFSIDPNRHITQYIDSKETSDIFADVLSKKGASFNNCNSEIMEEDNKKTNSDIFKASADPKSIGEMFKAVRIEKGLTRSEVARHMETSPSALVRIENGEQNASVKMVDRYAAALGCSVKICLEPTN